MVTNNKIVFTKHYGTAIVKQKIVKFEIFYFNIILAHSKRAQIYKIILK